MRRFSTLWRASGFRILRPPRTHIRHQHEAGGHKWYFQDPPPQFRPGPTVRTRLSRSLLYASTFALAGFGATNAFSTWTWLNTCFQPGEEADIMYLQLIEERLSDEPLTKLMEEEESGWIRDTAGVADGLDKALRGSRGVQTRIYINRSKGLLIVMVHFGEGCEGFPAMVHGGIISSYVHNAMEYFAPLFLPPPAREWDKENKRISQESWEKLHNESYWKTTNFEISFERPVTSGDAYAIIIIPALLLGPQLQENHDGHMPKVAKDKDDFARTMIASLMQIDYLPYEEGKGRRNIRYANAVGLFGHVEIPHLQKPFELSSDGKIS